MASGIWEEEKFYLLHDSLEGSLFPLPPKLPSPTGLPSTDLFSVPGTHCLSRGIAVLSSASLLSQLTALTAFLWLPPQHSPYTNSCQVPTAWLLGSSHFYFQVPARHIVPGIFQATHPKLTSFFSLPRPSYSQYHYVPSHSNRMPLCPGLLPLTSPV